ncbi:hypothetical protein EUA93_14820 [Nocardioides oleivorans]|uniref:Glycosyltransferase RgtA/B/C/D-like domain-containing protein n=1 Tax=Nocardioides oleivorans TaxID=273676 RepID=A0A4Q2S1I2_9ACTN|nr:hypothetical protein [Nocardioides oleivorans]RYB95501.1 hypothetical protein EUA93_14820 [Nocardioides oleivorans]
MITTFIRRVLPLVGLAAALVVLIGLQDVPAAGSDAWLHLRLGQEFRDGWSLAHPGHLGVYDTATWYPTQWASQLAMSWTWTTFGTAGIIWLAGALTLLLPVTLYLVSRRRASPLPAVLAACLGVCAAAPGLTARPQLVSYLFIAIVVAAWLRTVEDGRPRWWLVALTWVWVPLHGMWIVGVSIGVAVTVGIALSRRHDLRRVLQLASIPVLSTLVTVATPLGLDIVDSVTGVGTRNSVLTEWGPPDFTSPGSLFLVLMVAIVLVVHLRGDALDWPTLMLLGLSMAWGLYSVRTVIVAGIMLTPLVAVALQRMVPPTGAPGRREVSVVAAITAVALGALAVTSAQRADQPVVASWVDSRLDAMPSGTKVLDDWPLGHYVLANHPQVQVVMHGYVEMFTPDELDRNVDITRLNPDWDSMVDDLDVDYALVDPDSQLGYALVHQLGWTTVEGDDDYVLLVPAAS